MLALVIVISALYLYNIYKWGKYPDFGFAFRTATGMGVIGIVGEKGLAAGLQVGDRILAVNDQTYDKLSEFRSAMHRGEREKNTYLIQRNGREFHSTIPNTPMGFKTSFFKSGFLFLLGLCYFLIGTLVFLMKPHQRPSWVFFLFTTIVGFFLIFLYKISKMTPSQLETFHIFTYSFTPAVIIHLAASFPEEKNILKNYPTTQLLPYFPALIFFLYIISVSPTMTDVPKGLLTALMVYMVIAVLFLIGSCVHLWLASRSEMVKLRAKMILLGISVSASVPLLDLITSTLFELYLLPGFNYYLPFFICFPLFVGYSIIKHDLFDIGAVIKRTYGYVLTTGAVAGIYGFFILISNLVFGGVEYFKYPIVPLFFLLVIVLLLSPIRYRIQKFVDRIFYRLEYDYQDAVQQISETMRTLASLPEILKSIVNTALELIFIDSGCILLLNSKNEAYECEFAAGIKLGGQGKAAGAEMTGQTDMALMNHDQANLDFQKFGSNKSNSRINGKGAVVRYDMLESRLKLPSDGPLIQVIAARKKEVTIYDVKEDPIFNQNRAACEEVFNQLGATLIVPLIYEEKLIGLISLGVPKSGRFYRREDINLLKTLANQGAVALENAILLGKVIEKERMDEELSIARDLQRRMLPATCPEIEGFDIAAICTPARAVGGDFYDFIEMQNGRMGMVLGDVSGQSVSGALVLSASRTMFRMLSEDGLTFEEIMSRANRRTKRDMVSNTSVALLYAVFNPNGKILNFCCAGLTQPIQLSAKTGRARLVRTEGDRFPLGIIENPVYRKTQLAVKPDDIIVFYTDGVVEAMNELGELFGFERLLNAVQEAESKTADGLLKDIMGRIDEFVGEADQHDDLTIIVASVQG